MEGARPDWRKAGRAPHGATRRAMRQAAPGEGTNGAPGEYRMQEGPWAGASPEFGRQPGGGKQPSAEP